MQNEQQKLVSSQYVRLNERYKAFWPQSNWPSYRDIEEHCGKRKGDVEPMSEDDYSTLKKGARVQYHVAVTFVDYLYLKYQHRVSIRDVFLWDHPAPPWTSFVSDIISEAKRYMRGKTFTVRNEQFIDEGNEENELAAIAEQYLMVNNAYFGMVDPRKIHELQEMGLKALGWKSVGQLAAWLTTMCDKEPLSVMYGCHKDRAERTGATIAFPLTKEGFDGLLEGRIGLQRLGPNHLVSPSKYIFLYALIESEWAEKQARRANRRLLLWQCAYFTRGIERPVVLAPMSVPQYEKELELLGYRDTGVVIRGTTYKLLKLEHPDESGTREGAVRFAYNMQMKVLRQFQDANKELWKHGIHRKMRLSEQERMVLVCNSPDFKINRIDELVTYYLMGRELKNRNFAALGLPALEKLLEGKCQHHSKGHLEACMTIVSNSIERWPAPYTLDKNDRKRPEGWFGLEDGTTVWLPKAIMAWEEIGRALKVPLF
jgi:hypothetical protein